MFIIMCYIRGVYHSTKECVGDCDDISQLRRAMNTLLFYEMMLPALHYTKTLSMMVSPLHYTKTLSMMVSPLYYTKTLSIMLSPLYYTKTLS